jgi:isochorismate synthase
LFRINLNRTFELSKSKYNSRDSLMNNVMDIDVSEHQSIAAQPSSLLDQYNPDSSIYFSSPKHALLAKPPFANLLDAGMSNLSQRISESLRLAKELGHKNSVVIGAIAFDVAAKSYLRLSTHFERADMQLFRHIKPASMDSFTLTDYTLKEVPEPEDYVAGVKEALARFARGELDKVVLSRTLEIDCKQEVDVKALVKRLEARNTSGYTFAVRLQDSVDNEHATSSTLIGASPELLISRHGNKIITNPLAGSEPRSADPIIDQARAQQLLASPKDRQEHALVIKAVAEALRPLCRMLHVPKEPSLINTPTMWHLSTVIEGELADTETSSIDLALALHPTPAVCGYPRSAAHKAIAEIEAYDRGLFTGMVGWCDDSGDGEWVVTIRCAEVASHSIRLYAGAGVVAGSSPEKELAETGAKFNTMLNALGIKKGFSHV